MGTWTGEQTQKMSWTSSPELAPSFDAIFLHRLALWPTRVFKSVVGFFLQNSLRLKSHSQSVKCMIFGIFLTENIILSIFHWKRFCRFWRCETNPFYSSKLLLKTGVLCAHLLNILQLPLHLENLAVLLQRKYVLSSMAEILRVCQNIARTMLRPLQWDAENELHVSHRNAYTLSLRLIRKSERYSSESPDGLRNAHSMRRTLAKSCINFQIVNWFRAHHQIYSLELL